MQSRANTRKRKAQPTVISSVPYREGATPILTAAISNLEYKIVSWARTRSAPSTVFKRARRRIDGGSIQGGEGHSPAAAAVADCHDEVGIQRPSRRGDRRRDQTSTRIERSRKVRLEGTQWACACGCDLKVENARKMKEGKRKIRF